MQISGGGRHTLSTGIALLLLLCVGVYAQDVRIDPNKTYVQEARERLAPQRIPADADVTLSFSEGVTYVTFSSPVRFVPWMSEAYYDITVGLETDTIYSQSLASPEGYQSGCVELPFYTPSNKDWVKIRFVAGVVAEALDFDFLKEPPDGRLTIYEREGFYQVELVSQYQESRYKVEKGSGRIYDEGHVHLVPDP